LIAVGLFATKQNIFLVYNRDTHAGLFMGGGGMQLGAQLVGSVVIISWGLFWACGFFYGLDYLGHLRVDRDYELRLFEETLTNLKVTATLHQMAHDYQLDAYVRNVEDEQSYPDIIENIMKASHSSSLVMPWNRSTSGSSQSKI